MNRSFSSPLGLVRPARLVLAGLAVACCTNVHAGKIIVDNDEWTLSDSGFSAEGAANGTAYAQNGAAFLTGGTGSILIYSDNFGLTSTGLQSALTGAGYSVTEDSSVSTPFTASTLSGYKAVYLAGDTLSAAEISALTSYENSGGGVYIAAGTGDIGGAASEAAQWNSFLNSYGLSLASVYNGIVGDVPVVSTSPVLAGVSELFYDNGNTVSASGSAQVITYDGTQGLIGVYSSPSSSTVPDGASTALLAGLSTALLLLGARYSRLNSGAKQA